MLQGYQLLIPPITQAAQSLWGWHCLASSWLNTETEQPEVACLSLQSKSENVPFLLSSPDRGNAFQGSSMAVSHSMVGASFQPLASHCTQESAQTCSCLSLTQSPRAPGGHSWEPCSLLKTDLLPLPPGLSVFFEFH